MGQPRIGEMGRGGRGYNNVRTRHSCVAAVEPLEARRKPPFHSAPFLHVAAATPPALANAFPTAAKACSMTAQHSGGDPQ